MPSNNSTSRRTTRRRAKRSADKRIASLVTKEVVKLIPQIVDQVHSHSNSRAVKDSKTEAPQSTFLYKHFKACDLMEFTGEGGVTQLLQWFDSIEVTLRQSGCPIVSVHLRHRSISITSTRLVDRRTQQTWDLRSLRPLLGRAEGTHEGRILSSSRSPEGRKRILGNQANRR
ncbi:hypothetical protein HanRHA438_Chr17g0816881 [Helianthus annuus]|nr:hypothetical protein HanRHA438_Chr17g0816881 [Helianthus annuus]